MANMGEHMRFWYLLQMGSHTLNSLLASGNFCHQLKKQSDQGLPCKHSVIFIKIIGYSLYICLCVVKIK